MDFTDGKDAPWWREVEKLVASISCSLAQPDDPALPRDPEVTMLVTLQRGDHVRCVLLATSRSGHGACTFPYGISAVGPAAKY